MNDHISTDDEGRGGAADCDSDLINALQRVLYLHYFEIPLLTHHRDKGGQDYLDYWCDRIGDKDRRLVFRVRSEDLDLYLNGRKSLRDLILNPPDGFYYVVDALPGAVVTEDEVTRATPSTIDEEYVPDPDSFHDPSDVR